jgi:hypothetical protein
MISKFCQEKVAVCSGNSSLITGLTLSGVGAAALGIGMRPEFYEIAM